MKLWNYIKNMFCENEMKWQAEQAYACKCEQDITELKESLKVSLSDIDVKSHIILDLDDKVTELKAVIAQLQEAGKFKKADSALLEHVDSILAE